MLLVSQTVILYCTVLGLPLPGTEEDSEKKQTNRLAPEGLCCRQSDSAIRRITVIPAAGRYKPKPVRAST